MRSCCLAGPLTVRRSPRRTQPLTPADPRAEKAARLNALKERLKTLEKKLAEKVIARTEHSFSRHQTGVAPPAAAEAEAAPEAAKQAMEVSSEPSVASPAKGAGGDVEMGSDHDSDFAPPKLTKRPSRRGQ